MLSYMLQAQDPWGCSLAGKPLVEEEEPEVLVGYGWHFPDFVMKSNLGELLRSMRSGQLKNT